MGSLIMAEDPLILVDNGPGEAMDVIKMFGNLSDEKKKSVCNLFNGQSATTEGKEWKAVGLARFRIRPTLPPPIL